MGWIEKASNRGSRDIKQTLSFFWSLRTMECSPYPRLTPPVMPWFSQILPLLGPPLSVCPVSFMTWSLLLLCDQQHGGWAESTPWVSKTKAHALQVIPRPVSFSPLQLGTILYPLFLSWPFGPWTYLAFPSIKIIALKLRCFFFSQAPSLAPLILSKHNPVQKHLWLKYVSYTVSPHLMLSIGSVTISKTACDETSFTTDQLIQERVKFLNISSTIT